MVASCLLKEYSTISERIIKKIHKDSVLHFCLCTWYPYYIVILSSRPKHDSSIEWSTAICWQSDTALQWNANKKTRWNMLGMSRYLSEVPIIRRIAATRPSHFCLALQNTWWLRSQATESTWWLVTDLRANRQNLANNLWKRKHKPLVRLKKSGVFKR